MRNRRVLSNLAEGVEKARFPSIVSSQSASITLITLNSKRKRSALSVPSHFHDRIHDARWQAMPAYDKLTDGRILPTQFRQAQGSLIASNWRNCTCVRWDAGIPPPPLLLPQVSDTREL